MINGVTWAIQNQRTPLIVEGDSMVIINLTRRIMHGATINQVSCNWRWEFRLSTVRERLSNTHALSFSHIKTSVNKVADILTNEGVGKSFYFNAEISLDKLNR